MKHNTKKVAKSTGYLITKYKVTREARQHLVGLMEPLGEGWRQEATRRLFYHLVASTLLAQRVLMNERHEVWVPMSSTLIREEMDGASWKELKMLGLIEALDYSYVDFESREFRVVPEIMDYLVSVTPETVEAYHDIVNLMDGQGLRKAFKHEKSDAHNNRYPQLIVDAMAEITEGICDLRALEAHVRKLKLKWLNTRDSGDRARYINDLMCLQVLFGQDPEHLGGRLWSFKPAYKPQQFGRISHIGGGLQTCSGEMKDVAYKSVDNLYNYDLKASQVNGLRLQFVKFGLPTDWVDNYLADSEAKHRYATGVGITVETWKNCMYAIFMGAGSGPDGAVAKYIWAESTDELDYGEKYRRFFEAIGPLKKVIEKWHKKLMDHVADTAKRGKKGLYIKNATDSIFWLEEEREAGEGLYKRRLAAFVLQGQEAAFIHHLTKLAKPYGFKVVANEHDGIVTIGQVPAAAVEEAAELSGLAGAQLVEKPFASLPPDLVDQEPERGTTRGTGECPRIVGEFDSAKQPQGQ